MAGVRGHEELLRIGVGEELLNALGRGTPDREAPVAVVVRQHHQEGALAADEERGRAVAEALAGLGQREAKGADPP